jgi:prophage regulatory protein
LQQQLRFQKAQLLPLVLSVGLNRVMFNRREAMMPVTVPTQPKRTTAAQPLNAAQFADALLRLPTVQALTGLSKTTIYTLVARRDFPEPIRRGNRCTRWRSADVTAWLQAQGK